MNQEEIGPYSSGTKNDDTEDEWDIPLFPPRVWLFV